MFGLGLTKLIPYLLYLGGFSIAFASLFKPKIGLYFMVLIIPFRIALTRIQDLPMGKDLLDVLFLCVLLGYLITRSQGGKSGQPTAPSQAGGNKSVLSLFFFYIGYSFFSLILGAAVWGLDNPLDLSDTRFISWKNHVMLPILGALTFLLLQDKKDLQRMVILLLVVIFFADLKYFQDNRYTSFAVFHWKLKQSGIFEMLGGNVLAAFHAYLLFLPLGLMLFEPRIKLKLFYGGLAAFTFYPVLFLFSRGAYAGVWLGAFYIGLRKWRPLALAAILLPVFWATVLPPAVIERIEMTQAEGGELDASASRRFEIWGDCLRYFARSPIFGVGFDTFHIEHPKTDDPHNVFIEILAEQGLIGITVLLLLFMMAFRGGAWLRKNAREPFWKGVGLGVSGASICFAAANFFGDRWSYLEPGGCFFVLLAIVARARLIIQSEIEQHAS